MSSIHTIQENFTQSEAWSNSHPKFTFKYVAHTMTSFIPAWTKPDLFTVCYDYHVINARFF